MKFVVVLCLMSFVLSLARAEGGYTNHAGNVIAGFPTALTPTQVMLGHGGVIDPALPTMPDGTLPTMPDGTLPATSDGTLPTIPDGRARTPAAPQGEIYPLSIFPESEQRRIAADFGEPRLPLEVKRAIAGAEKAMARSRKRAEKGLCTKDESEAFCVKSETALKTYLDKQVESGTITPAERKAIGR